MTSTARSIKPSSRSTPNETAIRGTTSTWLLRTAWLEPRCFPNSGAAYQHTFGKRRRFQPSPAGTRASVLRRVGLEASGGELLLCGGARLSDDLQLPRHHGSAGALSHLFVPIRGKFRARPSKPSRASGRKLRLGPQPWRSCRRLLRPLRSWKDCSRFGWLTGATEPSGGL